MDSNTGEGSRLPWYLDGLTAEEAYSRPVPWFTLDFETTNQRKGDARVPENRVVLTVLKVRMAGSTAVIKRGPGINPALLLDGKRGLLIAHNAKFELAYLIREGVDVSQLLVFDTMLAEYVIAGNRRFPLDLDSVARKYGFPGKEPLIDAMMTAGVCPSEMPEHLLEARCIRDVETTEAVAFKQMALLIEQGLLPVFFTRCITTPVLAHIEKAGLYLDPEEVQKEHTEQSRVRQEAAEKLSALTGGINLSSPKQMGVYLYDTLKFPEPRGRDGKPARTAGGGRMTDADTLEALPATTKEQKEFKKWRAIWGEANAALTKTLDFFLGVCREYGETFQGTFNQAVTQTHRLSSSGVPLQFRGSKKAKGAQLQNMPRVYKKFFRPRGPDYVYVETDGVGMEFRCAGDMAHDPQVRKDIVEGADVHRFTASILNRCDEAAVSKAMRTDAKPHTFKPLYGGMSGTPRQVEYYEAFREKYAHTYKTQMGWVETVLREKKLRIPSGLIFYWPDTKMTQTGYITNTPNIFNYPVQSFATADIIPISLVYTFWRVRAKGIRALLVNTVHDSVAAEVHREDVDKYRETILDCWLDDTYSYLDRVYRHKMWLPLAVGFTVGPRCGVGDEEKHTRIPKWQSE